ncbi:MAG: efflux RND transporter periplasmic adaptor subunit [Flavimaricola sp.]|nr:efflux RND transporter periplasmic adaptor subunit [Flavimaricola sp.]
MPITEHSSPGKTLMSPEGPQPAPTARVPALRQPLPTSRPSRRRWLWGGAVMVAIALIGGVYSQVLRVTPPVVAVETAALAPVTRVLAVNGRIAAVNSVEIRSVVSGSLDEIPVAEGDRVAAGQVLARIDAAAQNAIVRQAMAGLDAALVAQQQATEAYDRSLSLGAAIARTALEADAFAVRSATQEVARQSATLDQAQIVLETFTIRAPFAGTILTLYAEPGQLTGPSSGLLTLADLSDLVVEADVDEAYATQIALGQPAVLQLAGATGTVEGHVRFVSNRVDVATGGLAIRIAFDAPVTAPVGLTVATNIIVDQQDAALTVPRTAILSGTGGTDILVLTDGIATRRALSVVDWPAARLIVTDGLVPGDVVILDATGITDGQTVAAEMP